VLGLCGNVPLRVIYPRIAAKMTELIQKEIKYKTDLSSLHIAQAVRDT